MATFKTAIPKVMSREEAREIAKIQMEEAMDNLALEIVNYVDPFREMIGEDLSGPLFTVEMDLNKDVNEIIENLQRDLVENS